LKTPSAEAIRQEVVLGEGSEWIWNQAGLHFPDPTQIVDLYHASGHLWELVRKLHPNDEASQNRWVMIHQDRLPLQTIGHVSGACAVPMPSWPCVVASSTAN
jgi:hypothetical protein